ncbi:MAG TPA: phosphopantetheine-binding protein [Kofleriaceae bacterium]|jgi:acyl carrier protein
MVDRWIKIATDAAASLGLLDASGRLVRLDSIGVVDYAVALEEAVGTEIPPDALDRESFTSLEAVAALLARVAPSA